MIKLDKNLISELFDKAAASERKRMNYDLRTSSNDGSQRMLNALLPGTDVPIHRHPSSNEIVLLLCGKLVEVIYDAEGNETSADVTASNNLGWFEIRDGLLYWTGAAQEECRSCVFEKLVYED